MNAQRPDANSRNGHSGTRDGRRRGAVWLAIAIAASGCEGAYVSWGSESGGQIRPVATVDQIMDAIIIPSSEAIFDAVVYDNGQLVRSPKTDDDWFRLQMHAIAIAEAGNLLQMPSRARDGGEWAAMSAALTEAAVTVAGAAEAKDTDRLLASGSEMYNTCTSCHRQYIPEMGT